MASGPWAHVNRAGGVMWVKLASAVLFAVSALVTVGSVPLAFASLFSFDAPGAMSSLTAWGMFLLLISCPFLALGAAAIALANVSRGSSRSLLQVLAMLLLPAGMLLVLVSRIAL